MDEELHETLTVVEIPASYIREAAQGGRAFIYMAPPPDPVTVCRLLDDECACVSFEVVRLRLEPVMRGRSHEPIFWYAYAHNPELALKLRCAFLPGQIGEVQRREAEAYWRGAFAGLGQ